MWKIVGIECGFPVYTGNRRVDELEKTQHYTYFASDLLKAKGLGIDMIRYGIPWHRVEPQPGKFDWQWVDGALDLLFSLEMKPIVDLVHFGTPDWLLPDGGFASKSFAEAQARYAAEFAQRYPKVEYFTITNEPTITARFCGKTGYWHPFRKDAFDLICDNLAEGIHLSSQAIRSINSRAVIMQNDTCEYHHAGDPSFEEECAALNNERFLVWDRTVQDWDILGLDFYPWSEEVHSATRPEIGPQFGLYGLAKQYYARYKKPMILAETDAPGTVEERIDWMERTLRDCQRLNHEGIPMLGYTWWPLIDNINWGSFKMEDSPDNAGLYSMVRNERGIWEREETPLVLRFRQFIESVANAPTAGPTAAESPIPPPLPTAHEENISTVTAIPAKLEPVSSSEGNGASPGSISPAVGASGTESSAPQNETPAVSTERR
ncbi:MAG TPA: family 1 glycosylhydrolase [Armatimonadota bacterium]|nr:family 1 glycosylhydrolase [Armatimonadota bacterium]